MVTLSSDDLHLNRVAFDRKSSSRPDPCLAPWPTAGSPRWLRPRLPARPRRLPTTPHQTSQRPPALARPPAEKRESCSHTHLGQARGGSVGVEEVGVVGRAVGESVRVQRDRLLHFSLLQCRVAAPPQLRPPPHPSSQPHVSDSNASLQTPTPAAGLYRRATE